MLKKIFLSYNTENCTKVIKFLTGEIFSQLNSIKNAQVYQPIIDTQSSTLLEVLTTTISQHRYDELNALMKIHSAGDRKFHQAQKRVTTTKWQQTARYQCYKLNLATI